MKVLVISDHLTQGGAAVACNRLCEALALQPGVSVHRFVFNPCATPGRIGFPYTQGTGWRTESSLQAVHGAAPASFISSLRRRLSARRLRKLIAQFHPNVINLHNLHGFAFSLSELAEILGPRPIIWTLHDMWSFTGRCAYAYDCTKFIAGCDDSCPTPTEYPALRPNKIAPAWAEKRAFLQRRARTAAACPSAWLAGEAKRGFWSGLSVETLPNGLPLEIFFPVEKRAARAALGLPLVGLLGLAAADYLVERRKGGDMIAAALAASAQRPDFGLLTMGNSRGLKIEGVRMHALGFVSDDTLKRLVYSAADLLIHPAPVDNLPNTVVEALACGTPTVAFRIGGLPEMVVPGETGWLCPSLGAEPLGAQLRQIFDELAGGLRLSDRCRDRAVANHDAGGMAKAYLALFQQLQS